MGVVWRARQSSLLAERARKIDLMITIAGGARSMRAIEDRRAPGWERIGGEAARSECAPRYAPVRRRRYRSPKWNESVEEDD